MKKQNEETKVENKPEVKVKKTRAKRKFFLYADGKGLITTSDGNSMPTFNSGDVLMFDTKAKAVFARDFFVNVKLAESIDILTKVA